MKSTGKGLRQKDSEAVWMSSPSTRLQLEEEQETLQIRCTRNRTTFAELRACLQCEKDGKTPSSRFLRVTHHCDVQERVRSSYDLNLGLLNTCQPLNH